MYSNTIKTSFRLSLIALISLSCLLMAYPKMVFGKQQEKCIEKDTNHNNKIDQIEPFDNLKKIKFFFFVRKSLFFCLL